jgi:hypothetical protein
MSIEKKKKKDSGGYLPTPQRGYPWKCDCIIGNPTPDKIILDQKLHEPDCPVRKRIATSGYMEEVPGFG